MARSELNTVSYFPNDYGFEPKCRYWRIFKK